MATKTGVVSHETYRPDIAGTLEEFDLEANEAGFVGLDIAPVVDTDEQAGFYSRLPKESLLINVPDDRRNNDGSYKQIEGDGETVPFKTGEHGIEERVDARRSTIIRKLFNAELVAARRTRETVQRNLNKRIIDKSISGAGATRAAAALWTTAATNIIADVRTSIINIRNKTGMIADTMVIDFELWLYFADNDKLLDKFVGATRRDAKTMTPQLMADALNLREIKISGAVNNSANQPAAASFASMWDKTKALIYVSSNDPDMMRPRFMNTLHWGEDGSTIGGTIESYYDPSRRGEFIRHRNDVDEHVVYADCAEVITGVAA